MGSDNPVQVLLGVVVVFAFAAGVGAVNGIGVNYLKVPPMITTLCTSTILNGVALWILPVAGGKINSDFARAVYKKWDIISMPLIITVVLFLLMRYLLYRTRTGTSLYAIGRSRPIAASMGVKTTRASMKAYILAGLCAAVTGLLLAMCLPAASPYWVPLLGGVFAIVVVKQFYGGLGKNFMNPALAGRMLLSTFPFLMTTWVDALDYLPVWGEMDAVTSPTPMAALHSGRLPELDMGQMLLGQHGGSIGEVSIFMLLLGGLYLIMRRVISPRIPAAFLGTVAVLTFLFPRDGTSLEWMTAQLCSGGLVLGAFFMATDYTTSPVTPRGQVLYGVGCGLLTVLLRYYGSYPDGVGWAILTMNCLVWLMDRAGMPRRFGVERFTAVREGLRAAGESLSEIKFVNPGRPSSLSWGTMPGERYLDQLRPQAKAAGILLAVVMVTGLGIYSTYWLTSLDTQRSELRAEEALLAQVMPGAEISTETPYRAPNALSITAGYRENELLGYCVEVQTHGFSGPITMVVGVDLNGQVTGVAVTDHSESTGMGTMAMENAQLRKYVGMSGTIRTSGANSVDVVTGATATSEAITAGVNQALAIVANLETDGSVQYVDSDV